MLARVWPYLVLSCFVVVGCDDQSKRNEPVEDGEAMVRAALLDGSNCYGETPVLCIEDETFIASSIEAALETRWNGEMPKTRGDVEDVIRSARGKYRASMQAPHGLEMLERLVEERYANPVIDTETVPGIVSVDMGALPGELRANRRGAPVVLTKTDLLDGFDWKPSEAGRQLAKYADAHPDAKEIRIEVRYPSSAARHFIYRYLRKSNTIVHEELEVGRGDTQYVSNSIEGGLDTMRAGKLLLGDAQGKTCYAPRRAESGDCRVSDTYREAKKAAAKK